MEDQKVEVSLSLVNAMLAFLGKQEPVQLVSALQQQVGPQVAQQQIGSAPVDIKPE